MIKIIEDHFHFYSLSTVHSYDLYHINFTYMYMYTVVELYITTIAVAGWGI